METVKEGMGWGRPESWLLGMDAPGTFHELQRYRLSTESFPRMHKLVCK
jgi:hypothetical protein